jgi:pimeloyl-ACP methyl ester carboxylesterase
MSEHAHLDGIYPFPAVMQTRAIETNGTSIHVRVGGQPGARRAGFAQFLAFSQDAADNRTFLAQGKLQMPVLAFGGEATFGPMIGAVLRCVADNVEDVIIPDCGHWITEEQPQATTDLVVDFLHRRS